jgi:hypothetical protein
MRIAEDMPKKRTPVDGSIPKVTQRGMIDAVG